MRKLVVAVMAVAGLGVAAGCQNRSEVQKERQDVAEAQQEATRERQEIHRDTQQQMAEARQEEQQELRDLDKNVQEEQRDLTEAQREQLNDQGEATGGSGMANARTEEVKGTIQSASATSITLLVPDKNNQMMKFQANQQVQVTRDDKPVALTELKPGDEVRASYQMDQAGKMVLRTIELEKQSAQHPNKQKK
jgi:type II secretory pathway pseudopilin PulG